MKARMLVTAALGVVFAFTALTGAAFAGKPDDPGKSEQAPGQVKKAEKAAEPAPEPAPAAQAGSESRGKSGSAPGQVKKAENAPAATSSKGKSASAPGKTKTGQAATPSKGKSDQAPASVVQQQQGPPDDDERGRSAEAHHHVIVCHRTGSDSNPYVVINIPMTAWTEAHSPDTGSHPTLNGRDDILLKDPASGPGTKDGFTKGDCGQPAAIQQVPDQPEPQPQPQRQPQPEPQPEPQPQPDVGEVAGAQAVITPPAAPAAQQPTGGVLGALGAVGQAELPFTGLPLWIAALIGIALVSVGIGARHAMR